MTNFTIMRVAPDMAPALKTQFDAWSSQAWAINPYSPDNSVHMQLHRHARSAAQSMSAFGEDESIYYVAYRGAVLEGALEVRDHGDRREIGSLFSNPQNLIDKKKAGVGVALIRHVAQEIVCRKEPVPLTVRICSTNMAVPYYTKLGFQYSWDLCAYTLSLAAMKTNYVSLRHLSCSDRLYYGMMRAAHSAYDFLVWYAEIRG